MSFFILASQKRSSSHLPYTMDSFIFYILTKKPLAVDSLILDCRLIFSLNDAPFLPPRSTEKDGFLILSQVAWAQKTVKVIDSTTGIELNTSASGDDDANSFCLPLIKGHTYDISCVVRYIHFLPFA